MKSYFSDNDKFIIYLQLIDNNIYCSCRKSYFNKDKRLINLIIKKLIIKFITFINNGTKQIQHSQSPIIADQNLYYRFQEQRRKHHLSHS